MTKRVIRVDDGDRCLGGFPSPEHVLDIEMSGNPELIEKITNLIVESLADKNRYLGFEVVDLEQKGKPIMSKECFSAVIVKR